PSQDGVVIAGRAYLLGLFVELHGFFEVSNDSVRQVAGMKLRFGTAFMQDAAVVGTFVRIRERFEYLLGFGITIAGLAGELVRNDQAEHALSTLVLWIGQYDVMADGFGLVKLIEIAIVSDLGEGLF